ncbi:Tat pathway signal protein [Arcobacter sp. KX21116]|uniref:Tat pathway signal protein n=1 Tax=Arcobacter iocasae TaxID=2906515 RepID=UPI0035D4E37A
MKKVYFFELSLNENLSWEKNMKEQRRSFIKKALGTSAVIAATGVTAAMASSNEKSASNGVVVGKSPKKEILYRQTPEWEAFYKSSN